MHLDEEQIQRALHGELDAPAKQAVDRHVVECAACRSRLEQAGREEEWIFDLLRRTDPAAPLIDAESVARRARAPAWTSRWARRAAGILIAIAAAGAAYTAPGSPVPAWLDRVAQWMAGPAPRENPGPVASPTAGIAVAPGERLTIRFAATQSDGRVVVTLTSGPNVVARALNGTATFTTGVDRLTIENRPSTADYEIELPRDAARVEVVAGEHRLLLEHGRVVTDGSMDERGRYVLPLVARHP